MARGGVSNGWLALAVCLAVGWGSTSLRAATETAEGGRYHLSLRDAAGTGVPAVFRTPGAPVVPAQPEAEEGGGDERAAVADLPLLILEENNGQWTPAFFGEAPFTRGIIRRATREGGQWRIVADAILGGVQRKRDWLHTEVSLAEYEITFTREGDRIVGAWQGTIGGQHAEGRLAGLVRPLRSWDLPPAPPPGEHPRFLFRREELPALKAKARTQWGAAMLKRLAEPGWSRSGTAVAQGLLYQLTGEAQYASRARQLVDEDIRSGWWQALGPIHDPAHKATEALLAYDLVHDTYALAEHAKLRAFLRDKLQFLFNIAEINSGNGHPHSNWSGQYRAAAGMVALALLADPAGGLPSPPPDWDFPKVAPPPEFKVREGMPVLPVNAAPLRKWLYSGPLNIGLEHDGLQALGGASKAWPTAGTAFQTKVKERPRADEVSGKYPQAILFKNARPRPKNQGVLGDDLQPLTKEFTASFAAVPEAALIGATEYVERGIGSPGMIHLWRAAGCRSFQTLYFFAVLDNPQPQYVQVRLTSLGKNDDWRYLNSCLYLSGQRFEQADALFLDKGRHPVLRQVTVGMLCEAHGRHHLYDEVWLKPLDAATVAKARAVRNSEAAFRRRALDALKPRFDELGRPDLDALLWLPVARRFMDRYAAGAISERGWHCAGQCYTQHPLLVANPFLHAFRNATGTEVTPDQHLGWFLGQAAARTVFSEQWARMEDYGRGGGPVGVDLFGRGFANVPPEIRAPVFAAWQRTAALTERGLFKAPEGAVEQLDPLSAAFTFVNWPAGDGGEAASASLPNVVVDRERLGYTMRNRWQDGDDIVAVFTGFRHPGGDWGCEGAPLDLRLQGLGTEWLVRGNSAVTGMTSRVAVEGYAADPQDVEQRYCAAAADGSAVVTLGYTFGKQGTGLRSFATDFSGTSGAPALFVLVDKFTFKSPPKKPAAPRPPTDLLGEAGFGVAAPNCWRLVTEAGNQVAASPGAFTVTGALGATLRGTIVAPATAEVAMQDDTHKIEINYRYDHQGGTFTREVIRVPGQDYFFVVLTLQKGDAPAVRLEGDTVRVGRQTIRFDGEKVVLGQFSAQKQ